MATTTPNNGWSVPTSTDYVKDGATAIETLGDAIDASVGTGLLAWTSYTPTLTNMTLGNGTVTAKYAKLGKIVHLRITFTLGSTSAMGTGPAFSLPPSMTVAAGQAYPNGTLSILDSGTAGYTGTIEIISTNLQCWLTTVNATYPTFANIAAGQPMVWTTNDVLSVTAIYEVA
jgi:hypothetical protein